MNIKRARVTGSAALASCVDSWLSPSEEYGGGTTARVRDFRESPKKFASWSACICWAEWYAAGGVIGASEVYDIVDSEEPMVTL